jgi:hypothetical protein
MKTNITMKGKEVLNFRRKTDKYSESSIDLASHTQIIRKQNN